jgi:hypothetical protein
MAPLNLLLLSVLGVSSTTKGQAQARGVQVQHQYLHNTEPVWIDYQCFGDNAAGLRPSNWLPFDTLWEVNEPYILSTNGGDTYITHHIKTAIDNVAKEDGLDDRLVLVIMLQEVSASILLSYEFSIYDANHYHSLEVVLL